MKLHLKREETFPDDTAQATTRAPESNDIKMKSYVKTVFGIAGIIAAVTWSVYGVDFDEVWQTAGNINVLFATMVLILTTVNLGIRAVVWKSIINPLKPILISQAVSSYLIGVFSNLFLPFKLGDVAQGVALGRRVELSKISSVSAVLIQRVFEITSLMLIMSIVAVFYSVPLLLNRKTGAAGAVIIASIAALFLMFRMRETILPALERFVGQFSRRLGQRIRYSAALFLEGTRAIHQLSDVVKILSLSLSSWIIQIVMVQLTTCSLDIQLDLASAGIVLLIINIGLIIPVAPGNIGTFQFFSILALSLFSVEKSKSLTFAVIFQVIQGVPVIIGGGISLLGESLRSRQHAH